MQPENTPERIRTTKTRCRKNKIDPNRARACLGRASSIEELHLDIQFERYFAIRELAELGRHR